MNRHIRLRQDKAMLCNTRTSIHSLLCPQAEAAAAAATDRRARSRARWDQQGGSAAPNGDVHATAQQAEVTA